MRVLEQSKKCQMPFPSSVLGINCIVLFKRQTQTFKIDRPRCLAISWSAFWIHIVYMYFFKKWGSPIFLHFFFFLLYWKDNKMLERPGRVSQRSVGWIWTHTELWHTCVPGSAAVTAKPHKPHGICRLSYWLIFQGAIKSMHIMNHGQYLQDNILTHIPRSNQINAYHES